MAEFLAPRIRAAPAAGASQHDPVSVHMKRRDRPAPGSITEALDSFRAEVRFYREIAPVAGVRVPACYRGGGHRRRHRPGAGGPG